MNRKLAQKYRDAADLVRRECPAAISKKKALELALEFEKKAASLESKGPAIEVRCDLSRFSRGWPHSWNMIVASCPAVQSEDGFLRGTVNLDTGDMNEAQMVISGMSIHLPDRRKPPFIHISATYPRLPDWYGILSDIRTMLSYHGLTGQPAVWIAQGRKAFKIHVAACRVLKFPDENGNYHVAEPFIIDEITRSNGRISRQYNHAASCEAAAFALCKRHELSTDGFSYNDRGELIGQKIKSRFDYGI